MAETKTQNTILKLLKDNPLKAASAIGTIATLIGSVVGGLMFLDNRYAAAADFQTYKIATQSVQQQTSSIEQMLKMQMQTRITILQMKQASGKLSPEEQVELNNLLQTLKEIEHADKQH